MMWKEVFRDKPPVFLACTCFSTRLRARRAGGSRSACKGSNRFLYLLYSLRPGSQQIRYILLSVKGLNLGVISGERSPE